GTRPLRTKSRSHAPWNDLDWQTEHSPKHWSRWRRDSSRSYPMMCLLVMPTNIGVQAIASSCSNQQAGTKRMVAELRENRCLTRKQGIGCGNIRREMTMVNCFYRPLVRRQGKAGEPGQRI